MKVYLVRHAHTPDGPQDDPDRTLDDIGEAQAHAIRKFLKLAEVHPDVIISSDFARAEDTAKILQRGDTPLKTTPFLRPDGDGSATSKAVANAWKSVLKLAGDAKAVLIVTHGPLIQALLASIAFNFVDEQWQWEHGAVAYVNTHESRFRWFVTPKLAAHLTGAEEPPDVEDPEKPIVTGKEAQRMIALSESLKRAHKAQALDPLKSTLRHLVARRFRKQKLAAVRAIKAHSKNWGPDSYSAVRQSVRNSVKINYPQFGKGYAVVTNAARQTGADHVVSQLGDIVGFGSRLGEAAPPKKIIPLPGPPTRTAQDLEDELDDTTADQTDTKLKDAFAGAEPLAIAAVLELIREQFQQYADGIDGQKSRAATVAEYEVSNAYHGGGKAVADQAGAVEKYWDIGDEGCPICEANEAQGWIDGDEVFDSGDDQPPAHPNCDCSIDYRPAEEDEEEV